MTGTQEAIHVIVVAGYNYAHHNYEFDDRSINRIGWFLENHTGRREPLIFHYLSVGHGTVARSVQVDPGFTVKEFLHRNKKLDKTTATDKKSFWESIDRDQFAPVTKANYYYKEEDWKYAAYGPLADPQGRRAMSMVDVYSYVAELPSKSVQELSFFSHSGDGGPILTNSSEKWTDYLRILPQDGPDATYALVSAKYEDLLLREPWDRDARKLKDFLAPVGLEFNPHNFQPSSLSVDREMIKYQDVADWFKDYYVYAKDDDKVRKKVAFMWYVERCRAAFREDAELWIWGCLGVTVAQALIKDVLTSRDFSRCASALLSWTDKSEALIPATMKLRRFWIGNEVSIKELRTTFRLMLLETYASSARYVFNIKCIQAFPGTTTDLEPRESGRFPLMTMAARFRNVVQFYLKVIQSDTWDSGTVRNTYKYSAAYPYATYWPKR